MSLTVLSDVILRNEVIAASVSGQSRRLNQRVPVGETGQMSINAVWSQSLREYTFGTIPVKLEVWQGIYAIFEITEGGAFGFLVEDPTDSVVMQSQGAVALENGVYQLQRRYIDQGSGRYKDRRITRPRAAGFMLYQNGVAMAPGAYTLNAETGVVTVSGSPDPDSLSWAGVFYVPVHFKEDSFDWDLVLAGKNDKRLVAGPSVVLVEVRE